MEEQRQTLKQMPEHIRKKFKQKKQEKQIDQPTTESVDILKSPKHDEQSKSDDKKEKQKKKLSKKSIIIISVVVALCVVGLTVGLVLGLLPRYTKMDSPQVNVISLSDRTIVSVDANADAVIYEFVLQAQGEQPQSIRSNSPSLTLTQYLKTPGVYQIRARYIGENEAQNSDLSEVYVYQYYQTLQTPNATKQDDKLVWERVGMAGGYRVYYGTNDGALTFFTVDQPSSDTQTVEFNLSQFDTLPAKNYFVYVQAVGLQDSYYVDSDLSTVIEYANVKTLATPSDVTYNRSENLLTFTYDDDLVANLVFELNINGGLYIYKTNVKGNISIDLMPYINSQSVNNLLIRALGDDVCLLSSDWVNVTVN